VFQAWKAWRSWPKTAVALALWWQWVLHFRSLEKYTSRSFSLVICSKVSLESDSADFYGKLDVGTEVISLIFENHILTFLCVETHLPIACPGCQKIDVGLKLAASFPFLMVAMIFVSSAKSCLQWCLRLVDMSLMNRVNRSGPRTEPWGTPLVTRHL
jgi:hypothetical protein